MSDERQTCKSSVLKHGADPEKESNVLSSYLNKNTLKNKLTFDRQITLNSFLRRLRRRFLIKSLAVLCVRGRPVHVLSARNREKRLWFGYKSEPS